MNQSQSLKAILEATKMNVAATPLDKARAYAMDRLGDRFEELLPNFDRLYLGLQKMAKAAPDIPRSAMPVIRPGQIDQFKRDLEQGNIDLFRPFAFRANYFPTNLLTTPDKAKDWLTLGQKDGNPTDDVIKSKRTRVPASKLKPTQKEIWLDKLIDAVDKFGPTTQGSHVTEQTIIMSKDFHIIDGHHRYGQIMLVDPSLRIDALVVPLDIDTLLKMGRSYGNAIGNPQRESR